MTSFNGANYSVSPLDAGIQRGVSLVDVVVAVVVAHVLGAVVADCRPVADEVVDEPKSGYADQRVEDARNDIEVGAENPVDDVEIEGADCKPVERADNDDD